VVAEHALAYLAAKLYKVILDGSMNLYDSLQFYGIMSMMGYMVGWMYSMLAFYPKWK